VGLEAFITRLTNTIREDFLRWNEFEKSARVATHVPGGVIELMPTSDATYYAFKYVNGHPKNTQGNLLTIMSFGMLSNVSNGLPVLVSEMTVTTALRTAATSAMAAKALARPDSKVMALIGAGAQSEFQALAFNTQVGIEEIRVFDIDPAAMQKFANNMSRFPKLKVTLSESVRSAVKGSDIVTTITADRTRARILEPDMIEPGMHINGVGGDCPGKTELAPGVLQHSRVFVEFEPQSRIEGDIQQLEVTSPVTELWKVLSGLAPGRESSEQITIFDSVGFAIEDFSALRLLYELAETHEAGTKIDLIPMPANPKDLFQYVV
jgi:ornithine cyclodeaminase